MTLEQYAKNRGNITGNGAQPLPVEQIANLKAEILKATENGAEYGRILSLCLDLLQLTAKDPAWSATMAAAIKKRFNPSLRADAFGIAKNYYTKHATPRANDRAAWKAAADELTAKPRPTLERLLLEAVYKAMAEEASGEQISLKDAASAAGA